MVEKTPKPACGADVLRAIRNAYPGNMVIARVLGALGIGVLSAQELQAAIPGFKPEPERNLVLKRTAATVEDALFFQPKNGS
jgi:hypothetical protein